MHNVNGINFVEASKQNKTKRNHQLNHFVPLEIPPFDDIRGVVSFNHLEKLIRSINLKYKELYIISSNKKFVLTLSVTNDNDVITQSRFRMFLMTFVLAFLMYSNISK